MEWKEIIKIFIFGITLGFGPCLVSCLPVLLPYITARETDWKTGLKLTVIFSIARILSYSILAIIAVTTFRIISKNIEDKQVFLNIITGVFIIIIGILYSVGKDFSLPVYKIFYKNIILNSKLSMFILGLFIGFSPCGPLLGMLTYIAAISKDIFSGFCYGLIFGIGTFFSPIIPSGALAGLFSENIKRLPFINKVIKILSAFILIFYGLQLIIRYVR